MSFLPLPGQIQIIAGLKHAKIAGERNLADQRLMQMNPYDVSSIFCDKPVRGLSLMQPIQLEQAICKPYSAIDLKQGQ